VRGVPKNHDTWFGHPVELLRVLGLVRASGEAVALASVARKKRLRWRVPTNTTASIKMPTAKHLRFTLGSRRYGAMLIGVVLLSLLQACRPVDTRFVTFRCSVTGAKTKDVCQHGPYLQLNPAGKCCCKGWACKG